MTFDACLDYRPTVSVVILSHRPEMLIQALRSVWDQHYPQDAVEIIVKFGTMYHGDKINEGIAAARGDYLVPLCDDDLLHPDALMEMTRALDTRSDLDFVYSDIWLFGGPDGDRVLELPEWHPSVPTQRCVPWVTACYRRALLTEPMGGWTGYEADLQYWDWGFARRLGSAGKRGLHIPKPLFRAREHPENGHKQMNHGHAFVSMYAKHLQMEPPIPVQPEFVYPPYYEGRPAILTEADLRTPAEV